MVFTLPSEHIDVLSRSGLSKTEIRIYTSLIQSGPQTIQNLSKYSGLKRSTVHHNIQNLIQKDLVTETYHHNKRLVRAEAPDKIENLIRQKQWELKSLELQIPAIVENIYKTIPQKKKDSDMGIRHYEGFEGTRKIYMDVLKATQIFSFVNIDQVGVIFPENMELFRSALTQNPKLEMWEIIENSDKSRKQVQTLSDRYHFKFVPKHVTFSNVDLMIYDDKIAMVQLSKTNPNGVIVDSPTTASCLRAVHSVVWNILPDVNNTQIKSNSSLVSQISY